MKICPVGAELLHVDRWRDMTKLTVDYHNSADTPKMTINIHIHMYYHPQNTTRQQAHLMFNFFRTTCWRHALSYNFYVTGAFISCNKHIIFYFDCISVTL
jgi:formylmethanofuran dehydrogenase subunit A